MATSAAGIPAQEEAPNHVARCLDSSGGRWEVEEEDLETLATRVEREVKFSAAYGSRKFILMRIFFVLRVVCWSDTQRDFLPPQPYHHPHHHLSYYPPLKPIYLQVDDPDLETYAPN